MAENRIDLLRGKTELTQEELYQIVEFKQEYVSNDKLEVYTDKKYRELNQTEKKELIDKLLKADYLKYKNCFISRSKLLYDSSETLEKEITILEKLNNLGYEIHLLPYGYARDSMNCYLKNADSITNGDFLEFKTVVSTGKNAGQSVYRDARKQADNVFISLKNECSEEKIINNIYATIKETKKQNLSNSFEGLVFLNFEQDNDRTVLYNFDRDGYGIRLDNPSADYLKKIKGIVSDSQVLENPMYKHGSSPTNNIKQQTFNVNEKSKDWEQKYDFINGKIPLTNDEKITAKSDKEIIQTYISKIKEMLPASMKNSVETVLASSAKALSSFSKEEKLVIGKYLTENGVTNSDNLGNFLKKKVEPEHKKELKRDIEIERGR